MEKQIEKKKKDKGIHDDFIVGALISIIEYSNKETVDECSENIAIVKNKIELLKEFRNKNQKLTLQETREMLSIINDFYRRLKISYDERKVLPLEDMDSKNSEQVEPAPIPKAVSWLLGEENGRKRYRCNSRCLWKKYQKEFEILGIDIKKENDSYESGYFKICVKLGDISDLPIDYKKVKLVKKEKLKKIIEREEGNEIE